MVAESASPLKLRRVSLLSILSFLVPLLVESCCLCALKDSTPNEELLSLGPGTLYGMLSYPAPIGRYNHPRRIAAAWFKGRYCSKCHMRSPVGLTASVIWVRRANP
jgi:hypothetical protein